MWPANFTPDSSVLQPQKQKSEIILVNMCMEAIPGEIMLSNPAHGHVQPRAFIRLIQQHLQQNDSQ